jgi:hypothetical protein
LGHMRGGNGLKVAGAGDELLTLPLANHGRNTG